MLADLAEKYALVEETFNQASDVLGFDLWQRCQHGPEQDINRTELTQPLLLTASWAIWRIWQQQGGPEPVVMAGHSLGEYSALTAAQAVDFQVALGLVEKRGQFMQNAVPEGEGAMAVILNLADKEVIQACTQACENQIVTAVNFNSPGQVVIAGHKDAVDRAMLIANSLGAKRTLLLPVSVPSHCELMLSAAEALRELLSEIEFFPPHIPVISNVDVHTESDPALIRAALTRQLYQPVRWVEIITHMRAQNIDLILECGPGTVLTGLNKRIDKNIKGISMGTAHAINEALAIVRE
jgi:[acyl-carrier-protein] S-malonyltransferase